MAKTKDERIIASGKRHAQLAAEAKRRKMSIKDVAEEKFEIADKTLK